MPRVTEEELAELRTTRHLDRLRNAIMTPRRGERLAACQNPNLPPDAVQYALKWLTPQTAAALLGHPNLEEADLHKLAAYGYEHGRPKLTLEAIEHPNAGAALREVYRELIQEREERLQERFAELERTTDEELVRQALSRENAELEKRVAANPNLPFRAYAELASSRRARTHAQLVRNEAVPEDVLAAIRERTTPRVQKLIDERLERSRGAV